MPPSDGTPKTAPAAAQLSGLSGHAPATEVSDVSFQIRDLSALSFAQGFTHWHYRAGGLRLAEVLAPDFFNPGVGRIATGDHIKVSASDGGADLFVHRATAKTITTEVMSSTALQPQRKAA